MRTISANQSGVLSGVGRAEFLRVEIKDSGGTFRDMSSYPGYDAVDSASLEEDVDNPHIVANVTLKREMEKLSISPFMQASAANRGFDPLAAFAALVTIGREIKISIAIMPADTSPASGDYLLVFHGYIDVVDPGSETKMTLMCRDLGAKLADTFIEREKVYNFGSSGGTIGMYIWEQSRAYVVGDFILPTEFAKTADVGGKARKYFYKCTTAGTSGANEPTWPISLTVTDGTAVHTFEAATGAVASSIENVIQKILNDNGLSTVTLYTPTSPAWNVLQFIQERKPVLEAIRDLAFQIGWDIRYKFRASTSQFELTLYQPDRTLASPNRTFTKSEYISVDAVKLDIAGIRNVIRVIYPDTSTIAGDGNPIRAIVEVSNSASITTYGRRFMEISEDKSSLINTSAEATSMANAALNDLKDPVIDNQVTMSHGFPWTELGDLYRFTANDRHYSANQDLALYSYRHELSDGMMRTTLSCRGKPSGGYIRWHRQDSLNSKEKTGTHLLSIFDAPSGLSLSSDAKPIGGVQLNIAGAQGRNAWSQQFEWHIAATASFTPDSTTLHGLSPNRQLTLSDLTPGSTYYAKIIPRIRNFSRMSRGQPSNEISFVAGKAQPIHLDNETVPMAVPPNGNFEGWFSGSAIPPDNWTMVTGTWDDAISRSTSTVFNGTFSLKFNDPVAVAAKTRSDYFPVKPSVAYTLETWIQKIGTPTNEVSISVEWYTSAKASISTSTYTRALNLLGAGWESLTSNISAPATAAYARFAIAKASAIAYGFFADGARLVETPSIAVQNVDDSISPSVTKAVNTFSSLMTQAYTPKKPNEKVLVLFGGSFFTNTASDAGGFKVTVTPSASGTSTTLEMVVFLNAATEHQQFMFAYLFDLDSTIEAKTFDFQWRRQAGTGTLTMDLNDSQTLLVVPLP